MRCVDNESRRGQMGEVRGWEWVWLDEGLLPGGNRAIGGIKDCGRERTFKVRPTAQATDAGAGGGEHLSDNRD